MFSIDAFVDQCRSALQSDDPPSAVATVLRDALQDRGQVATAIHEWRANGGGAFGAIHRARDLTILHASVTPGFESPRHNHKMWAVIGVFEGEEDNTFYRPSEHGIEEAGRTAICEGDAQVLAPDVIHRIANLTPRPLHAIHVYGGDLLGAERAMWDEQSGEERRFDFAAPPIQAMSN
jgi:predicted metal-dependent enzyme (double-stranded beta helix superfamily)